MLTDYFPAPPDFPDAAGVALVVPPLGLITPLLTLVWPADWLRLANELLPTGLPPLAYGDTNVKI